MAGGFVDWAEELLAPFGRVSTRRMFSAHGLYPDGLFVARVKLGGFADRWHVSQMSRDTLSGTASPPYPPGQTL